MTADDNRTPAAPSIADAQPDRYREVTWGDMMPPDPYGCLMCKRPVEHPEFTLLCNECEQSNLDFANLEVIPPAFGWESQACQYAPTGPPGLNHEQHACDRFDVEVPVGDPSTAMLVDCLLMRDVSGALVGILNHYTGENQYEKTGNVNIWVRPDRQRRGIATALLREARDRWNVDWRNQRYTVEGLAMLGKLLERRGS